MDKIYSEKMQKASIKVCGSAETSINEEFAKLKTYAEHANKDVYFDGETIQAFEKEMAEFFGKEDAAFFISGTMAQQSMMRVYCDKKNLYKIAYHPTCHMEIHEKDGLKELHKINTHLIGEADKLFTLQDLKLIPDVSCVVFELPQREIGGAAPDLEALKEMIAYLRGRGIKCHLDGARILEILPFYKYKQKEIFELFDSIYMSFYKGLGGIAGAILVGTKEDVEGARLWRKRYGGTLVYVYPYLLSAKQVFSENRDKMEEYLKSSVDYASRLQSVSGLKIKPEKPQCNMFHIHFDFTREEVMQALIKLAETYDIALFGKRIRELANGKAYTEITMLDNYARVDKAKLDKAIKLFDEELAKLK